MTILIVGAGIGGLTAALTCAHFGHRVMVLEQAATLSDVGAGIQIPPNAMTVFRALGLQDRVKRNAVRPQALEMRDGRSGRSIFSVPLPDSTPPQWGAPYLHIHRADYVAALMAALKEVPSVQIRLGVTVASISQHDTAVTAHLSDGTHVSGDLLIGADGLHSNVRRWMHGADKPVFTGHLAWRTTVPIEVLEEDAPDPTACVWVGPRRHAVTYRLRGGALANFVGVVESEDPVQESWSHRGRRSAAMADFANWHPVITRMIDRSAEDTLFQWSLYDRAPLPYWVTDRVALLGDAAHPMLPFMAQGAAMAVEDAWVLAETISQGTDLPQALQRYQAKRLPRTSKVQRRSRANAKTFHKRTAVSRLATYGPMWVVGQVAPSIIRGRLDWLYGVDVTGG